MRRISRGVSALSSPGQPHPTGRAPAFTRTLASALDALAELAWPTRCVCCNLPGELLCGRCRAQMPWIEQRWACPACGAPFGWLACTECDRSLGGEPWPTRSVVCATTFEGVAASMPPMLKDAHELRLAPVMAAAMAGALEEAAAWPAADGDPRFDAFRADALCFVPATGAAYARRGYDHMELVCRALSGLLGLPLVDVLVSTSRRDQRRLERDERRKNLAGSVRVLGRVDGLCLLLADDVVTTGATLSASARALLDAGATSVTGCAFSRVWQG